MGRVITLSPRSSKTTYSISLVHVSILLCSFVVLITDKNPSTPWSAFSSDTTTCYSSHWVPWTAYAYALISLLCLSIELAPFSPFWSSELWIILDSDLPVFLDSVRHLMMVDSFGSGIRTANRNKSRNFSMTGELSKEAAHSASHHKKCWKMVRAYKSLPLTIRPCKTISDLTQPICSRWIRFTHI